MPTPEDLARDDTACCHSQHVILRRLTPDRPSVIDALETLATANRDSLPRPTSLIELSPDSTAPNPLKTSEYDSPHH